MDSARDLIRKLNSIIRTTSIPLSVLGISLGIFLKHKGIYFNQGLLSLLIGIYFSYGLMQIDEKYEQKQKLKKKTNKH